MGMAASQARFLNLTARLSNLEFEGQQINQARMDLADKTAAAATEYQKAMNNRTILFDPLRQTFNDENNYQVFTYDSIVDSINDNGLGMRLVNADGKIIVPALPPTVIEGTAEANNYIVDDKIYDARYLEEGLRNKGWNLQQPEQLGDNVRKSWSDANWEDIAKIFDATGTEFNYDTIFGNQLAKDMQVRLIDNYGNILVPELPEGVAEGSLEAKKYIVDPKLNDDGYLEDGLKNKTWSIQQYTMHKETNWLNADWRSLAGVFDVYDTTDDGAAEAKYTELTAKYQKQDKELELRLKQIESEHSAVQTEMDAVKKVLDKNIETTFKTFG